jgi:hypothetical protein
VDSAADSIPAANKVFDVAALVPNEKRAGLKNLHIVDPPPAAPYATLIQFFPGLERLQSIRIVPDSVSGGSVGLILPKATKSQSQGIKVTKPTAAQLAALREKFARNLGSYDVTRQYTLANIKEAGVLSGLAIPKGGLRALMLISAPKSGAMQFSVIQEESQRDARVPGNRIVGGSTFVIARKRIG